MLLIDTQLIVLLVVGLTSTKIIRKHKNLTAFTEADFDLLRSMIGQRPDLIMLPNIASEASSLLRQHKDPERSRVMSTFREVLDRCREIYVDSTAAASQPEYMRQGITDSAILAGCKTGCRILTSDFALHLAAERRGLSATNFNHWRERFGSI